MAAIQWTSGNLLTCADQFVLPGIPVLALKSRRVKCTLSVWSSNCLFKIVGIDWNRMRPDIWKMKWPTAVIWWVYIYIIILFPSEFHYDQLISMINHPCLLYSILIIVIALQFCLNLHFHAPCSSFGRWKISTCLGEHQVSIKSCTSITHIQIYFFLLK